MEAAMAAKFNPAPPDKYAANRRNAALTDRRLEVALIDSFPASDPVSEAQPAPSEPRRKTRMSRAQARASASKAHH
jgi:hypothetical protein